jgi:flagellar protein FliS
MNPQTTYRDCSVGGASPIGLMIVLFDRLVGDLRSAAEAVRRNDIEGRCRELNHALLIIGQLESWVDREKGGETARQLATFYSYLRTRLLEASARQSAELFEAQMQTIVHIRSKWQLLENSPEPSAREAEEPSAYAQAGGAWNPKRVRLSQEA